MEQMLGAFQSDLSSISCEIRALQEHSVAMNLRLQNRRAVRQRLARLLDELLVEPAMIRWGPMGCDGALWGAVGSLWGAMGSVGAVMGGYRVL